LAPATVRAAAATKTEPAHRQCGAGVQHRHGLLRRRGGRAHDPGAPAQALDVYPVSDVKHVRHIVADEGHRDPVPNAAARATGLPDAAHGAGARSRATPVTWELSPTGVERGCAREGMHRHTRLMPDAMIDRDIRAMLRDATAANFLHGWHGRGHLLPHTSSGISIGSACLAAAGVRPLYRDSDPVL